LSQSSFGQSALLGQSIPELATFWSPEGLASAELDFFRQLLSALWQGWPFDSATMAAFLASFSVETVGALSVASATAKARDEANPKTIISFFRNETSFP
jgi:hypothetical protein